MNRIALPILLSCVASFCAAQESADDWKTRWQSAKDRHAGICENHKNSLINVLGKIEERYRSQGDVESVRKVKEQIVEFELEGTLPTAVKTEHYRREVELANKQLQIEAGRIKAGLLTANRDVEAAELDAELKLILNPVKPLPEPEANGDRIAWLNLQKPGGNIFWQVGKNDWRELLPDGKIYVWKETRRTDEMIELDDQKRNMFMRLHSDRGIVDYHKDNRWGRWASGKWITKEELAGLLKESVKK